VIRVAAVVFFVLAGLAFGHLFHVLNGYSWVAFGVAALLAEVLDPTRRG